MIVAIIPARGGSKRIPRKNIKLFGDKPMMAWSIEAARRSGEFDHIIVSTDDPEIADVARKCGATIPFIRPPEISDDYTGTIPVIAHAIDWVDNHIAQVKLACCIYATAPFLNHEDIREGRRLLERTGCQYALSVTRYPFPIQRAVRITEDSRLQMFNPDHFNTRSQDLEDAWHDAGQFYWGRSSAWLQGLQLFAEHSAPIPIPRNRVQDIDTVEDWERAEWMFKAMHFGSR